MPAYGTVDADFEEQQQQPQFSSQRIVLNGRWRSSAILVSSALLFVAFVLVFSGLERTIPQNSEINAFATKTTNAAIVATTMNNVEATTTAFSVESLKKVTQRQTQKKRKLREGCTTVVVGKLASETGHIMISQTVDDPVDPRLGYIPAKKHVAGAKRNVYQFGEGYPRYVGTDYGSMYFPKEGQEANIPIGNIPQASETFGYYAADYGLINEWDVGIVESTSGAKIANNFFPTGIALLGMDELTHIGLERAKTAREAVAEMGRLGEVLGFAGIGESLIVADPKEAWVFHIMAASFSGTGSAVWIAQRVPDDHMTVVTNAFTIRHINLKDKENYMGSSNIEQVAQEHGWWLPSDGPLHFARTFGIGEYMSKYYAGHRMWRLLSFAAPSLNLQPNYNHIWDDPYPWSVKPDRKLGSLDMFRFSRDHYENTPFDLTVGLAAGPFGTPTRFNAGDGESEVTGSWERPISSFRTCYTVMMELRPSLSLLWYGPHVPHATTFHPIYVRTREVPHSFTQVSNFKFSRDATWWAFRAVTNLLELRYNAMQPIVKVEQDKWDRIAVKLVEKTDAIYASAAKDSSVSVDLASISDSYAEMVRVAWWKLFGDLLVKFADGYNLQETGAAEAVGYPAWWLKAVQFDKGNPRTLWDAVYIQPYKYNGPNYVAPNSSRVIDG